MRIGIDLGGTKVEGVVLGSRGEQLARVRVATPAAHGHAAVLAAVVDLVAQLEARTGRALSVGVGAPGTLSPVTGLMRNCNLGALNDHPLDRELAQALGRPVALANDANCFALSEAVDGAGVGARVVFGVILGSGCGGGIVIDGRVLVGANAIAGEWGHNPLPWPSEDERPGPPCFCGRRGCAETWVSGPGLSRDHQAVTGERRSASELAAQARAGDAGARASLERHAERLARGLAAVVNLLDPDVIVLGGGLSQLEHLYAEIPRLWGPFVASREVSTRLVPARHGDSSGVRGAAWLPGPALSGQAGS